MSRGSRPRFGGLIAGWGLLRTLTVMDYSAELPKSECLQRSSADDGTLVQPKRGRVIGL